MHFIDVVNNAIDKSDVWLVNYKDDEVTLFKRM